MDAKLIQPDWKTATAQVELVTPCQAIALHDMRRYCTECEELRKLSRISKPPAQVVRYLRALFMPAGDTPRFESLAAAFRHDTGMMAPGKDVGAGDFCTTSFNERQRAWREWHEQREAGVLAWIDAIEGRMRP